MNIFMFLAINNDVYGNLKWPNHDSNLPLLLYVLIEHIHIGVYVQIYVRYNILLKIIEGPMLSIITLMHFV